MPDDTNKERSSSDIAEAVDGFLRHENHLGFSTDIREGLYTNYESYVPHIVLLIRNGYGVEEIANYLEKLVLERSRRSDREKMVKMAERLLRAVVLPNISPERTLERQVAKLMRRRAPLT